MPITRSSEVPRQEMMGTRLYSLAGPDNVASGNPVLRGTVSAGGTSPAHSRDHEEILYFVAGAGTYTIGDETGSVSAGDVILVPTHALHTPCVASG